MFWLPLRTQVDTTILGLDAHRAKEMPYIASMGIYVIGRDAMHKLLEEDFKEANDFGSEVIPGACAQGMKVGTATRQGLARCSWGSARARTCTDTGSGEPSNAVLWQEHCTGEQKPPGKPPAGSPAHLTAFQHGWQVGGYDIVPMVLRAGCCVHARCKLSCLTATGRTLGPLRHSTMPT